MITVRNLSHTFPNGRQVLSDISLSVSEGESVAIVGPNGAGKSTLLFRLAALLPGSLGQITINQQDPANKSTPVYPQIGIVFQNPDDQLFCPTVGEDVAFGCIQLGLKKEVVEKRVADALATVNLTGFENRSVLQLSGGEKRRVALAGVHAMGPTIYLFDEPTAYLDPRSRRQFIQLLQAIPKTKLVATHDLDFALDCCDRTILLDQGKLIADSSTRELLANEPLLSTHGLESPWRLKANGD